MKRADFIRKMGNFKTKLDNPAQRSFGHGKGKAHEYFKAKLNKKKLPELEVRKSHKDPEYAKLTIEEYEKKYLEQNA